MDMLPNLLCVKWKKTDLLILGLIYCELVLTDIFVLVRTASVCFRFFFPRNHTSLKRRPESDTYLRGILNVNRGVIEILRQFFQ